MISPAIAIGPPFGGDMPGGGVPPVNNAFLLSDNSSIFLLSDGTSDFLLS